MNSAEFAPEWSVELQGVAKHYGSGSLVVKPLSLQVKRGEFLTLLGPSGCGKTTTLRMIAGLEGVSAGRIRINGEDVTQLPPYARDTSIVFQDYALFPHLTVVDNVAFGLKMRGVAREERLQRAQEMLEFMQLPQVALRKPHQLSGGQRQRVALARSLIVKPAVLLLDEPLGALDAELRRQLQVELKRIQRQVGITFIYVTHDQEEALTMSDRIVVMQSGQIEQIGTPKEIYDQPQTARVARFIGQCNLRQAEVLETVGSVVYLSDPGLGRIQLRSTQAVEVRSQVIWGLRPERIRWDGSRGANSVRGVVTEKVYLGSGVRYQVAVGSGDPLWLQTPATIELPLQGTVSLAWDIEDAVLLGDPG